MFRAPFVLAAALAAGGVLAQTTPTSPASPTTPAAKVPPSRADGAAARLASDDRRFVEDAAKGGMAEVELGKVAQQKATHPQVKEFAARMVADHSQSNEELMQIAQRKGVSLPAEPDRSHQREAEKLAKASGPEFDRDYMKQMVADHRKNVAMFRKTAESAKDAEIKAFASRKLPALEEHLRMAQATESAARAATR